MRTQALKRGLAALTAFLLAACNGDDAADGGGLGPCEPAADAAVECSAPSPFEPVTYQAIFDNVLRTHCSGGGSSCHGAEPGGGGLLLSGLDQSYASLLGLDDGRARVVPGDHQCSILMRRLESQDPEVRMPRFADRLDDGLLCAVRRWIAEGAEGP